MKHLAVMLGLTSASLAFAQVEVPRSASPEGTFVVMMETDKDIKGYQMDSLPKMWIEDTRTKKRLADLDFRADPSSDTRPLRSHVRCLWSADSAAVAIHFSERFFTHMTVLRLEGSLAEPTRFAECAALPESEIIRRLIPGFKEFRSRWHQHAEGWIDQYTLIYTSGTGAITEACGDEPPIANGVYRFYVDFARPARPTVRRIEKTEE